MNANTRFVLSAGGIFALLAMGFGLWYLGVIGTAGRAPSLDRPITYPASLSEEARTILTTRIEDAKKAIRENLESAAPHWFDLAIQYKTLEDYGGAIEIWEYLAARYPDDSTPLYNLANTRHYILKDFETAEANFKAAIKVAPSVTINHLGLHELYRYSYKQDTQLAVDVLIEALAKVPEIERIDVNVALGGYYKEKGDRENARKYYGDARDAARTAGNTALVKQIDAEIGALGR